MANRPNTHSVDRKIIIVHGERMVDCPECGRQYATPEGECLLCEDGGPEVD